MEQTADTVPPASPRGGRREAIDRQGEVMQEFMARAVMFQDAVARAAGLNSTDLQTVGVLMREGALTPGQLAARIGVTSGGAITAVIDRLERAGYVRRARDEVDRRRVVVSAVPEALLPKIGPVYARIGERWGAYLQTLTDEQLRFANEFLERAAALNAEETAELRSRGG